MLLVSKVYQLKELVLWLFSFLESVPNVTGFVLLTIYVCIFVDLKLLPLCRYLLVVHLAAVGNSFLDTVESC